MPQRKPSPKHGPASRHPAERFEAPLAITAGTPLKSILDRQLVKLIAESIVPHDATFNAAAFQRKALAGLEKLELKERGSQIAQSLAAQWDNDFQRIVKVLIASFGPELTATEGNGLKPFFYLPHSQLIAQIGCEHFELGMNANYELTKRFTAEFSLRPFVLQHERKCLALLMKWTRDPNPHVRRLVSEGTRSRLPWAIRLKNVQENPTLTLPLLERLKDDPVLYVRRSVANHLADMLKDNARLAYETCERWHAEVASTKTDDSLRQARFWIIRHAVRLPAKKGERRALLLRQAASATGRKQTEEQ